MIEPNSVYIEVANIFHIIMFANKMLCEVSVVASTTSSLIIFCALDCGGKGITTVKPSGIAYKSSLCVIKTT